MIGTIVTDNEGNPIDGQGKKLSPSAYNPPDEVKKLFAKVQQDYMTAYALQHRPFQEFDGYSLLVRSRMDQETFGAYVGAEYVPKHKAWRWKGRKNTARNKLIGILAHMIAGMLYPFVYAKNEENEEDKDIAKVMKILVEEHLRKATYETKFLYMVLSALVNPAVHVEIEYVQAMQRIKQRLADGSIKIVEAVDELLSGLNLNVLPIDMILPADFFTNEVQKQPYYIRLNRIPWDLARKKYQGKFIIDGVDQFDFVEAGKTRVMLAGQENQTLYDIEWTVADVGFVQEMTVYYRDEDLETTWVGGVFMGNDKDIYNSNPFTHRRFTLIGKEWMSIPVYPFAKSYFEPIDPTGRFYYGKSGAFKEYWDALGQDRMHQIAYDGTYLDVIKPLFMSGVAKVDATVLIPGATIGMPAGAQVTPYQLGPNLMGAMNMMNQEVTDMSNSTQDKIMEGMVEKGVTAYATSKAENNARIFLGVFGIMMADLITKVGELTMDCIIAHETVGELDNSVPEALKMRFKTFLAKGKEKGKDITHRIEFTDEYMGRQMTDKQVKDEQWKIYDKEGGVDSDQRIYKVNPYQFARTSYTMYVDSDQIVRKSMGLDEQRKMLAFNIMTDPRVVPYTDQKAVVNEFAIEAYGGDDPDKFKSKGDQGAGMLGSIMGAPANPGGVVPTNQELMAKQPIL